MKVFLTIEIITMKNIMGTILFQVMAKIAFSVIGILLFSFPSFASNVTIRVIELEGRAFRRISLRNRATELPLSLGDSLAPTDFIRLESGRESRMQIQCSRGLPEPVPVNEWSSVNNICGELPINNTGIRDGSLFVEAGNLRGGTNPRIPYIVTPRSHFLLNITPTIRWNPVENAYQYTVSLMSSQETIWQIETTETTIDYPTDESHLTPGDWYTINVISDSNASSEDEGISNLRFRVLFPEEAHIVEQTKQQILDSNLSEQATNIALANLYVGNELISEAITLLETLERQEGQAPFIQRLLGDLYQRSGLRLLAEESYFAAIHLSETPVHLEQRAASELGLGLLYKRVEEFENALLWLNAAKLSYAELGEDEVVELITQKVEETRSLYQGAI